MVVVLLFPNNPQMLYPQPHNVPSVLIAADETNTECLYQLYADVVSWIGEHLDPKIGN